MLPSPSAPFPAQEAAYCGQCFDLDTTRALIYQHSAQRQTTRVTGVTDVGLAPRAMEHVAVIGGGLMGSGIVTGLLQAGYQVTLKEIDEQSAAAAVGRVKANLDAAIARRKETSAGAMRLLGKLRLVTDYAGFETADMVIEAAPERLELKERIFADLEKVCKQGCVLASNTSTIDITLLGRRTKALERIVGAHFFLPAHLMPLLEIVRSQYTSSQVLLDTMTLAKRMKKLPLVVGNCTGFVVNRYQTPYLTTAALLVDLGADPYIIDKALDDFGMSMGPFRMLDFIGFDVAHNASSNCINSYPERMYRSQLLPLMIKANRQGRKGGRGLYRYESNEFGEPDLSAMELVQESRRRAGMDPNARLELSDQEIVEALIYPAVNEGCRIVAEGMVDKPQDLDVSCVMGIAFPAWRGGPLFYGDQCGAGYVEKRLDELAGTFPKFAGIFSPCEYLRACARGGKKLQHGPGVKQLAKM